MELEPEKQVAGSRAPPGRWHSLGSEPRFRVMGARIPRGWCDVSTVAGSAGVDLEPAVYADLRGKRQAELTPVAWSCEGSRVTARVYVPPSATQLWWRPLRGAGEFQQELAADPAAARCAGPDSRAAGRRRVGRRRRRAGGGGDSTPAISWPTGLRAGRGGHPERLARIADRGDKSAVRPTAVALLPRVFVRQGEVAEEHHRPPGRGNAWPSPRSIPRAFAGSPGASTGRLCRPPCAGRCRHDGRAAPTAR